MIERKTTCISEDPNIDRSTSPSPFPTTQTGLTSTVLPKHETDTQQNTQPAEHGGTPDDGTTLTKDRFEILKVLGHGSYGTVYHVKQKDTGEEYALKELSKQKILKFNKTVSVFRERDILELLAESPFFVKIISSFQDDDNLYFLMEYVNNGTLDTFLQKNFPLDQKIIKHITS